MQKYISNDIRNSMCTLYSLSLSLLSLSLSLSKMVCILHCSHIFTATECYSENDSYKLLAY